MRDYNNNKLQEGTQVILDNLSEEYKKLLVEKALVNNNLKRTEDILPRDLMILNEEFKRSLNMNKYNPKRERSIKLIKLVGMLYTIIGIWLYIYTNISVENSMQKISVLFAGIGVLTTVLAYFYGFYVDQLSIRKKQYFELGPENEYKLVQKWNEIEKLSYLIINKENDVSDNVPITKVFNILFNKKILNDKDMESYKYILSLRNNIVHSTEKTINNDQIIEGLKKAESIITKLKGY
ncbi:hypothetical protein ABR775_06155 [Bacillus cereus]|uniref:hypothetical protein n=1 Tax=Bacillus cereus TaxID=1396 RepID=UPI0035566D00